MTYIRATFAFAKLIFATQKCSLLLVACENLDLTSHSQGSRAAEYRLRELSIIPTSGSLYVNENFSFSVAFDEDRSIFIIIMINASCHALTRSVDCGGVHFHKQSSCLLAGLLLECFAQRNSLLLPSSLISRGRKRSHG